jgi:hypothetical protein
VILKGNQRANGADLAIHLMNGFDNELVEIAQVRGAVASDLAGAFAEFEAIARGTRARDYLYSLSISPPSTLTRAQYFEAVDAIEQRLGLSGQPRAIVFHIKDGREHCHVVWSRIDANAMKAVPMNHDHRRLMDMSCKLARQYGLKLPPGLEAWEAKQKFKKDRLEPSLAEAAQEKDTGVSAEDRRAAITAAFEQSDNGDAFRAALEARGYILARGDQRGFVVIDEDGNVLSLSRYVKGHKAAAIKARLAPLTTADLPSVEQAKELSRQRKQARSDAAKGGGSGESDGATDGGAQAALLREALSKTQAKRRLAVAIHQQELLTRQQAERLALHAAQEADKKRLLFRLRSAVVDLIERTPGLRSVLRPLQQATGLDPRERQRLEAEALARRHAREKLDIDREQRVLGRLERREAASLERALDRARRQELERKLSAKAEREAADAAALKARQDFFDAAKDQGLWKERDWQRGDVPEEFNQAGGFERDADDARDIEALRRYEAEDAALEEPNEDWRRGGSGVEDGLDGPDDGWRPEGRKRGRRRGR